MLKRRKLYLLFLFGPIALIYFFYFQNNAIETTEYNVRFEDLPNSFDGYKIVQLSDLHSKLFGNDQDQLVKRVGEVAPDLIVFTGDLVDSDKYNEDNSLLLMKQLVDIAPVYFVTGNHEWWSGKFDLLEGKLEDTGVQVMRNTGVKINNGKDSIQIIGIDDPAKIDRNYSEEEITKEVLKSTLKDIKEAEEFTILLAHRPELFSLYSQFDFDLVFSGHAHGGQFRIPIIGGLVAPNQGLFPEYSSGEYFLENTTMIVSRGLGNSIIPIRLFNRPEIVVLTLKSE